MKLCIAALAISLALALSLAIAMLWRPSERFMVGTAGLISVNHTNDIPQVKLMHPNKRLTLSKNVKSFTVIPNKGHVALIFDDMGKQTSFAETKTTYPSKFETQADLKYYRAIEIRKK